MVDEQAAGAAPDAPVELFDAELQLSYLRAGYGSTPVVLLHGWSAFKEIWWLTMQALAPHVRVFAPDLPGHGASPPLPGTELDRVAERIALFCDTLGLTKITLVGHSMGGNLALALALAEPELVERMVLVDPAINMDRTPPYTRIYLGGSRGWATLRTAQALARSLEPITKRVPHVHKGGFVAPALRRLAYAGRHDPEALHLLLHSLFESDIHERLQEIALPTLVVSGEFDTLVPTSVTRELAAQIPGAKFAVIRNASHNPMDERPAEFAQTLLTFLSDAGRALATSEDGSAAGDAR